MYEYRKMSPREKEEVVEKRRQAGNPLHEIPHLFKIGGWFLITAATYEHIHHFITEDDRTKLMNDLLSEIQLRNIHCAGWVILPNHYHFLVECQPLSILGEPVRKVHARSARWLNMRDHTKGRKIWYRYSDRLIRDERHYFSSLNYIHYNPIKHGYCTSPEDWACSSYHWYSQSLGMNWLANVLAKYPFDYRNDAWFEKME